MSKRRHYDLGKWRLGKLCADYKNHKRLKRSLGYLDEPVFRLRRKTKCEHEFTLIEIKKYGIAEELEFEIQRCSKCLKVNWKQNVFSRSSDEN